MPGRRTSLAHCRGRCAMDATFDEPGGHQAQIAAFETKDTDCRCHGAQSTRKSVVNHHAFRF